MIHACFDALDLNGNGHLDVTDLIRSEEGKVLLEKMRLEHGIADSDRSGSLPQGRRQRDRKGQRERETKI